MRFELATAGRIVFGPGTLAELPAIAASWGRRPLLVTGASPDRVQIPLTPAARFRVAGEPTLATIREGAAAFLAAGCDLVIAVGGGSALDAGKAIAAAATNPRDLLDYVEVIGKGLALERPPHPFLALPTTAGTGSEVTRNAVLGSADQAVKVSLRSPLMLAKAAIVDPELTLGLPGDITAFTGLDALTQLIEPYVCTRANPFTDAWCLDGIRAVRRGLARACHEPGDLEARTAMAYASLCGGLALANAGLGVVHGFAAPIGGMFEVPHGAVCAALLPHGMAANIRAGNAATIQRYAEVARILTGDGQASAEDGVEWVAALVRQLRIPNLAACGIREEHVPDLAAKAARSSSMKANPVTLPVGELEQVLRAALVSPVA